MAMTQGEAQQLADEIRRTPGWQVLEVKEASWMVRGHTDYCVRMFHLATGQECWAYDREAWDDLKAKFAQP
jgi:hypothetical protein